MSSIYTLTYVHTYTVRMLHVCEWRCAYVRIARICTYMHIYLSTDINTCIYVHIRTYVHIWIYVQYVHIHAYTCIRSYTYIHAYTCNTCIYMHIREYMHIRKLKTYTCNIRAYMASICTYMHVYCTYITLFYIFWTPRRGRGSLPAEGHRPVQRALKKVSKTMQNAFDVFRSRTPVFPVKGGNLYHYAILAHMLWYIFAVYILFCDLYVHIRTYVHIRAYTYIFILKHRAKSLSGGVLEGNLPTFSGSSVKSCPLDLPLWAMRLDRQAWIWHGGRFCRAGGVQKGPGTRSRGGRGGGRAKSGVQKCRLRRKKMHAQMPWGALSGARWLPSIGNVF